MHEIYHGVRVRVNLFAPPPRPENRLMQSRDDGRHDASVSLMPGLQTRLITAWVP
jgi:hypothetical protein